MKPPRASYQRREEKRNDLDEGNWWSLYSTKEEGNRCHSATSRSGMDSDLKGDKREEKEVRLLGVIGKIA